MATVQASWTEWFGYMFMEVYGSEGYIRIDSRGKSCSTTLGDRNGREQVFDYSDRPPTSYEVEFADYLDALRTEREPSPDVYDDLQVVSMACGVYESARTGQRVDLLKRFCLPTPAVASNHGVRC